MADPGLYASARSLFLRGALNWEGDAPAWKLYLMTADYVVDLAAHSTLAQVSVYISTSGDILNRHVVNGKAQAENVVTIGGNIGASVSQAIIACGDALVWWSNGSPQLPYIADGGVAVIGWDNVALGPFALT